MFLKIELRQETATSFQNRQPNKNRLKILLFKLNLNGISLEPLLKTKLKKNFILSTAIYTFTKKNFFFIYS